MVSLGRILLVEDDPNDVELILLALAENRLANEVVVARDGQGGLDYLYRQGEYLGREADAPVVVLLDLKLPKVDGLELLECIKADPGLRTIPVVMLTSSSQEQDLIKSYDLGANAYVVKPVDFGAFVEAVGRVGLFWAVVNQPPPGNSD